MDRCYAGFSRRTLVRDLAFIAVSRREQTPPCTAVSLHVGVGVILTAEAPNRRRSSRAFTGRDDRRAALAKHTGEKMDTTTLLVIVLVVLLLGGGGFFYRRRV
jgi:LPXTG-motif cell wall-anchored protein